MALSDTEPNSMVSKLRIRPRVTVWRAAIGLALAIAVLFIVFPLGVGGDYPNHLARAYIETAIEGSEALQRYYEISWQFVPDFTIEMIVPRLEPFLGIYGAGAVVVAIAVVLAPLAGVALSRTLNGSTGAWAPLFGFACVFNRNLEFGFINFLFGLGLALFVFCLWVRLTPCWRRSLIVSPLAAFVAANHILGFLFLGYIALVWEGSKFAFGKRGKAHTFFPTLIIRDGLAFLPGLAMIAYAYLSVADVSTFDGDIGVWDQRFQALTAGFTFYNAPFSVLSSILILIVVAAGLYLGLRRKIISVHRELAVVAFSVFLLVLIMPALFADIWGLHLRYSAAALILAAAAVRFNTPERINLVGFAYAGVLVLALVSGAYHLARVNQVQQEIRVVTRAAPEGTRIISVASESVGFEIGVHGGSLSVIESDTYTPNLFTNISSVGVKGRWKSLHHPQGKVMSVDQMRKYSGKTLPPAENGRWSRYFFYGWPRHFTHVLYMRGPGEPGAEIAGLIEVASTPHAVLYEIDHETALRQR